MTELWLQQSSIEILGTLGLQSTSSTKVLSTFKLLLILVWSFSVVWFGHMFKILWSSGFYLFGCLVSVYGPHLGKKGWESERNTPIFEVWF